VARQHREVAMDLGAGREHERVQRASVNLRLVVRRGRPPEGRQVARHAAAREVEQLERGAHTQTNTTNTNTNTTKNTTTKRCSKNKRESFSKYRDQPRNGG
jgi:hypothetical protein